jgi:hypothetical protein
MRAFLTGMTQHAIEDHLPEIARIGNDQLQEGVASAWTTALAETDRSVADLAEVPWFPPVQRELDIDATLVTHVRDVTQLAVDIAETLVARRSTAISLDTVLAGALIHDVSKLYEFDGMADTAHADLLGHPYFGVHVIAAAGLPVELGHVVLSHSGRTPIEPATLEAAVVKRADEVAAAALRATAVDDLREA